MTLSPTNFDKVYSYIVILSLLLLSPLCYSQSSYTPLNKAIVLDQNNTPLEFATILWQDNQVDYTNSKGEFKIKFTNEFRPFSIHYANKQSIYINNLDTYNKYQNTFTLVDLSITLEQINIKAPSYTKQSGSNSAIIIDRQAIAQAQAFSLKDVLNNLPGHASVAPNLNSAQTINLRGASFDKITGGSLQKMNNSFGVAIIVDDVNISNDANMQTRSLNQFGMVSGANTGSITNQTYQGIDLREIPTENIESIEVVQGVASAKYAELTDGAIIINKQAGATPFNFTTNINRGATTTNLSKGFRLAKNLGALNLSVNYSKSNSDPRDKVKSYTRISQNLMWTKSFGKNIKNTFSFSLSKRLDNVREDPDDQLGRKLKASDNFFRASNRTSIKLNTKTIKSLNLNINGSYGISKTYNQQRINKGPFPIANKDTTGIYQGYYVDGRYIAVEQIHGKPISIGAILNASSATFGQKTEHHLSMGASLNYHDNLGQGTIYKQDQPRWNQNSKGNDRPYDFRQNQAQLNIGAYLMDNFKSNLFNNPLEGNIGFRVDIQNQKISYQPRINLTYQPKPGSQISFGYGISTKAPSLAHRFPAPIWLDFPLLNFFDNSNMQNSLYLVKTVKIQTNNNHLKPSKSTQFEIGYSHQGKLFSNSVFAYFKNNKDGFGVKREYYPITIPEYEVIGDINQNQKIQYRPTGKTKTLTDYTIQTITNSVRSKSYGIDWSSSSKKIESLNLYISLSHSLSYSEYYDSNPTYNEVTQREVIDKYGVYYTKFNPAKTKSLSLMSKLSLSYHVPKIGFIITANSDVFWFRKSLNTQPLFANQYLDKNFKPITIDLEQDIKQSIVTGQNNYQQPIFYVVNLNATKEIRKNIRIGINTYNFFNIRINKEKELSDGSKSIIQYNAPFSITGSISIKF